VSLNLAHPVDAAGHVISYYQRQHAIDHAHTDH